MRILWFTNSSSCYKSMSFKHGYNGGGWISSLEESLRKSINIELGISFFMPGEPFKIKDKNVTYYPIDNSGLDNKALTLIPGYYKKYERSTWSSFENLFKTVVDDFLPDIIQVFGSEEQFGLVSHITNVPVVLHIQGLINPYVNAFFPPGISPNKYLYHDLNPISILKRLRHLHLWNMAAMREIEILKCIKYYLGRTTWDKRLVHVFNANSSYYEGGEVLRSVFYKGGERELPQKITVVTTISSPMYKGFDIILKAANILKHQFNLDFDWHVYGDIDPNFTEHFVGINHKNVNVILKGVATAEQLRMAMLNATVYVHGSYIDNSPNSVCEAQILGVTPIVTDVGGVSSLVEDNKTGYVVPSNDPYQIAYLIKMLHSEKSKNMQIGLTAREVALRRHDKDRIVSTLIGTYKSILKKQR